MTIFTKPKLAGMPTWTDLTTPDIDAARKFYQEVFGWQYDIAPPEFGGYTTARMDGKQVAGLTAPMEGMPVQAAKWMLYFASDDAAADVARAATLGATVLAPAMQVGEFGTMAILSDPTGALFGFWQADKHIGWEKAAEFSSPAWLEMYAPDAKKARDFYTALLGQTADPMPGGMEYYVLKTGEQMHGGIMQSDPSWGLPAQWVTYFLVPNVDDAVAKVKAAGGKQMGNVDDSPFGRLAALTDPQGAIFKVVEPPKR